MIDAASTGQAGAGAARAGGRSLLGALLRVPLFYKILIANAAIIVVGAVAGAVLAAGLVRADPGRSTLELVGLLAAAGVAASVLVNAVILRVALAPLALLERTVLRVQRGELGARAPLSPLADRQITRLTHAVNGMLDGLAASRGRLREIAARAVRAEEAERRRIARELHDDTAQSLAALVVRLRLAGRAGTPEARETLLEEARREVVEIGEGVRRFARGLRPPALDELGLVPAIEAHARSLGDSVGLRARVEAGPVRGLLGPEAELALYRIVQEALSNVRRHAGTDEARVRISRQGGLVVAVVEDRGLGFQVGDAAADDGRGLGLFGMQERAAYFGGRVEVESTPGVGTRVRAEIPVSEEPPARG